ncbi:hypothetical protein [Nostoc sp.]|uniref:hypothetical protein n=1 Tax=Nostoc sp. TaxID=1180 RepID=UPI002FFC89A1
MNIHFVIQCSLALDPDFGQPLGLLWEKLWHRQHKASPPPGETSTAKKKAVKKRTFNRQE